MNPLLYFSIELCHLGGSIFITKGQYGTLKCLSTNQTWTFTLRKLLLMVYSDEVLRNKCAVGRKGAKHEPLDQEELGILKGTTVFLHSYIWMTLSLL